MVSEQFVQDSFCRPDRILKLLAETGRSGWQFTASDILNQEVSFAKGRIDILATFDGRKRLVVVEVKAGIAGLEALNQLRS